MASGSPDTSLAALPGLASHLDKVLGSWQASQPVVIGIGGPSGVGKTTAANTIARYIEASIQSPVLVLGLDDFFKSPEERKKLGEWGPDHIRFPELRRVLREIKSGKHTIETRRSVRVPKRAVLPWTIEVPRPCVVVFEGLYALSTEEGTGNLRQFVDFGIYLRADLKDVRRWRFEQEAEKPQGRNASAMERHWKDGILPDTRDRVAPTEKNADVVVEMSVNHTARIVCAKSR